jgi:alkylation response protein AidB-like acyl-CoA dehydrogenase
VDFNTIDLDAGTLEFWKELRAFLQVHATPALMESAWGNNDDHDWVFHRALAGRGWIAPDWPVELGGAGVDKVKARILSLELWNRGIPDLSRATTLQIADAIRPWVSEDLKAEVFPAIARGDVLICQGITEPGSGSDSAAAITRATPRDGGWVIDGQKIFSTNAQNCEYCFLLTRTDPSVRKHAGLTVFLVPLSLPGIEISPIYTLGGERSNIVFYDGVELDDRYRVGPVNSGWQVLNSQLDAEHGLVEGDVITAGFVYRTMLRQLFDDVLAWAREPDDSGQRPVDRRKVREDLAVVARDVEVANATPEPLLRVVASESLRRSAERCLTMIGPQSLVRHNEPGAIRQGAVERMYRAAQATSIYGGTTEVFRNFLAERVLMLPRQRPSQVSQ